MTDKNKYPGMKDSKYTSAYAKSSYKAHMDKINQPTRDVNSIDSDDEIQPPSGPPPATTSTYRDYASYKKTEQLITTPIPMHKLDPIHISSPVQSDTKSKREDNQLLVEIKRALDAQSIQLASIMGKISGLESGIQEIKTDLEIIKKSSARFTSSGPVPAVARTFRYDP
jgi:hypothetical protein